VQVEKKGKYIEGLVDQVDEIQHLSIRGSPDSGNACFGL